MEAQLEKTQACIIVSLLSAKLEKHKSKYEKYNEQTKTAFSQCLFGIVVAFSLLLSWSACTSNSIPEFQYLLVVDCGIVAMVLIVLFIYIRYIGLPRSDPLLLHDIELVSAELDTTDSYVDKLFILSDFFKKNKLY